MYVLVYEYLYVYEYVLLYKFLLVYEYVFLYDYVSAGSAREKAIPHSILLGSKNYKNTGASCVLSIFDTRENEKGKMSEGTSTYITAQ